MARSPKDEPRFNDMQSWNYHCEAGEKSASGPLNDPKSPPLPTKPSVINDKNMFVNVNAFNTTDGYSNNAFNVQKGETLGNGEENLAFSNMSNVPRQHNYGNAMLSLDNGALLRVFYDKSNRQLFFPNQYELFNHNTVLPDSPVQNTQQNIFNEFSLNNNIQMQVNTNQNHAFGQDNLNSQSQVPTSNILKEVLGNLEPIPNPTGAYSPFGQNYPLNHPDTSPINLLQSNKPIIDSPNILKQDHSPKRNENSPLADTSNKKRIVAEVKPMRPSYSDVLAKNMKNNQNDARKVKQTTNDSKQANTKTINKNEKPVTNLKQANDEKPKTERKQTNTLSSGSESGDFNIDEVDKMHKSNKRCKNKKSKMSRKWSSVDDVTNEDSSTFTNKESQFVFIEPQIEKPKNEKKTDKAKLSDKKTDKNDSFDIDEEDKSDFIFQDNQTDPSKVKKKKEKSYYKFPKPVQDKKKTQAKWKRNKPGYLGMAQNYLENWGGATWKAVVWFVYLLSDICGMSIHLLFDLCTSVFTQTYVSSQTVWRSSKLWLYRISDNKYLNYIDRKLGHTRFGFWRRIKWFKKESDLENGNENVKLNANIPLPATGEEAMKRLLACKGKDPYSILGVSVNCTDDEIKRYYRRQAFLVHPDKNQQPGAEEAFKILQHAFDLIGEPERREAYDRRALESRHVEAAWSELSNLLAQLHDKMEFAANTIRCTNCGRRHKRVLTERPCYAARYCAQCKIHHSAKEGDIWSESSMLGLLVMYYACMDGAVYQITQWASCQKKNLKQLRPDSHVVQYRIVLGNKAPQDVAHNSHNSPNTHTGHDPNLEEFLNNLYNKSSSSNNAPNTKQPTPDHSDAKKRRNKKPKA